MKTVKINGTLCDMTNSELYFIVHGNGLRLYVRTGIAAPHYCIRTEESMAYNGTNYDGYKPVRKFLHDCLHSAEEIIHGGELTIGEDRSKVGDEIFGRSHDENTAIAKKWQGNPNADNQANPAVGEAFVIVSTDSDSRYPYHAGAVVAVDGQDFVTLEASAGETDAQQDDRTATGNFAMYSAAGGKSFHAIWSASGDFGKTKPITVVIRRL